MTHRPAASFDGTPRRSNHSSIGTKAMATTSAAVTGRKNSAPARSANGRATSTPMPAISVSEASNRSRLDRHRFDGMFQFRGIRRLDRAFIHDGSISAHHATRH